ncbi:MAG: ADP-forming succinate--CoA ligase subunit beta [Phycisphaeraceae bacterium]|nr:ADP-forming succinate--CoA ligase subunit beta [Phycisphaeraceae bacterium]
MKIHEYQARELLAKYGVPVPPAMVAETGPQAERAFEQLQSQHGAKLAVVKAQVHAGGRGKGGGVKLVRSPAEAASTAAAILSKPLVTPQTGPAGVPVRKVLVAAGVDIRKEFYLGVAIDRAQGCPVLIASAEGGVDIEQVAHTRPDAILREPIDAAMGLQGYQARKIAYQLGFAGKQVGQAVAAMQKLAKLFIDLDCSLAEINPLVLTGPDEKNPDGQVLAIDAKINFDDNGVFRHPEIAAMADQTEENPAELKAHEFGLSYIKLDGTIGCLVNGAGLAMATMDLVKLHGAEPANFLDVGGSASEQAVTEAFRIILADPAVKGVLVNIFGGIMQCDRIARAIVSAAKEVGFKVPLVVRLEGTNVQQARQILEQARADVPTMRVGKDLTDAARLITEAIAA